MPQLPIEPAMQLAIAHHQAGRLADAEAIYRQVLALQPSHCDALHMLGVISGQTGRLDQAVALIRQAIAVSPGNSDYHYNLALILHNHGQLDQAIISYQQVLKIKPEFAEAHYNLANAYRTQGRFDQAIACYQQALRIKPNHPSAQNNLGNAWKDKGRLDQAVICYQQALALKPDYAEVFYNLGNIWKEKGKPDEALACYQRAVELKPDYSEARNNLGGALWEKGQVAQAIACYRKAWELNPKFISAHDNFLYASLFDPASDPQSILIENQRWNTRHAQALESLIQPHANDRNPDRRLRIGYVSPDFRKHPVGRTLLPVLLHHDRNRVEVVCYSSTVKPDVLTPRFKQCSALWRDVQNLSDEQLAAQVRADGIDILVDLTLHMAGSRLLTFARKPAPVQVTWLGYPGTTGLQTMDYRLTDPYMDPPGEGDQFYSEKSIRLPETFQCYDPLTEEIPVNELPATQAGYVTLGCLNNFAKINQSLLETWAQILLQSQGTRLLLKTNAESSAQWVRDVFYRYGLSPQRVEFAGDQPSHEAYLRLYQRIDLVLDPFPYNGHTTSMDAIWMGVPVVSWCGRTAVSRAGWSQSSNLGMPELTAMSREDYVHLAVDLAGDLPRLAELRRMMRPRMQASPLMDAPRFARGIEDAFRFMWRNWCEKQIH